MVLIIGGAYQGKLDFAKSGFFVTEEEIFTCSGTEIDFSKRCIDHIEEFTYACVLSGVDAAAYFESHREQWRDSILICQDISAGVVPMGADMRAWRQMNGLLCKYLSGEACQVSRLFCGLEERLK
ncbi:MAG: cobalamin biosynthesis protein CobU [Faecousia sp.]